MPAILQKKDLQEIVKDLCRSKPVIAPTRLQNGDLLYSYVRDPEEVSLETTRTPIMSAKEFFFESEEELFQFEKTGSGDFEIIPRVESEERVFMGIRSCDLKGVRFLQDFFQKPPTDITVTRKIEKTVFVSLGCVEPGEHCFCVCCDGGPFVAERTDAQMIDLGDRFWLEIFTEKGEELFRAYRAFLSTVNEEDRIRVKTIIESVDRKFTQRSYMAMGVRRISRGEVPDELWEEFGKRCISCGSCVFVCPTCSCFTVLDRPTAVGGSRIRTWDACNYSGFTREASGHNPRQHTSERLKRRFFHKLSYQCLQVNGRTGCVGCGRCVVSCPAMTDISTFVTSLRHTAKLERAYELQNR